MRSQSSSGNVRTRTGALIARAELTVVAAMLDALDEPALAELERALKVLVHPPASATALREAELGPLRSLLEAEGVERWHVMSVERQRYDAWRPDDAPRAELLVNAYGTWRGACRAAWDMGQGAWVWQRRRCWRSSAPYTRDHVVAAIRSCARELDRLPSASDYADWRLLKCRRARGRGEHPRLPTMKVIWRLYAPRRGAWRRALADASGKNRS